METKTTERPSKEDRHELKVTERKVKGRKVHEGVCKCGNYEISAPTEKDVRDNYGLHFGRAR